MNIACRAVAAAQHCPRCGSRWSPTALRTGGAVHGAVGQSCTLRAIEDPLLGPVVSFGLAGDAVNLLDDWAHRVPPLSVADIADLVRAPRAAVQAVRLRGPAAGRRGGPGGPGRPGGPAEGRTSRNRAAWNSTRSWCRSTGVTVLCADVRIGNPPSAPTAPGVPCGTRLAALPTRAGAVQAASVRTVGAKVLGGRPGQLRCRRHCQRRRPRAWKPPSSAQAFIPRCWPMWSTTPWTAANRLSHLIHLETHFDRTEVHRHITVLVLTEDMLVITHVDDQQLDEAGEQMVAQVSTESVPVTQIRSVVLSYMYAQPQDYKPSDPARELTLAIAWSGGQRLDMGPAGCGDPAVRRRPRLHRHHRPGRHRAADQRRGRRHAGSAERQGLRPGPARGQHRHPECPGHWTPRSTRQRMPGIGSRFNRGHHQR